MPLTQIIAVVAWILLTAGVLQRKQRVRHVPLMISGIGLDIGLVLYLQLAREAVQKAASFTLDPLHQIHIAFSTIAVLLYLPLIFAGFWLWRGGSVPFIRRWHIRGGVAAYICRTLGMFFMFYI